MRVISQSGRYDAPYEKSYISISNTDKRKIIAYDTLADDNYLTMAEYFTEEKALKAMEMLRETYDKGIFVPNDKYDPDYGENWLTNTKGFYHHTSIFQFPADDEIEV